MTLNKVQLIGRTGRDIELKSTNNGRVFANFSVVTDEAFKDDSGEWQKRSEWHNVTAWGKTATNLAKYCGKGSQIYIEGKIQTRTWEDQTGKKNYKTEIVALEIKFLVTKKPSAADDDNDAPVGNGRAPEADPDQIAVGKVNWDDVPF